ncbi:hypothetical protein [Pararhizobium sp.]|uniref:hypothetical protein n=1 Tax=Pararhizobium sp. TaxID=1977563 RepID=UPI003D14AD9F
MNTIFWSWQSDLEERVTRNVIREALAGAIEDLDVELDERHELTSDTQGVAGSPDIVATILAKIASAQVFVGDVTPLAVSPKGKALANPNVLIELGYAKRAIGLERVILVWNSAFEGATIDKLPFDMRGRRAPMSFHLSTGATTAELRVVREKLRKELRDALRLSIAAGSSAAAPSLPSWQPTGQSPGLWFNPENRLTINEDGRPGTKEMSPGPYRYVRILPRSWSVPAAFGLDGQRPVILGPTQGSSWGSTKGGFLVFTGSFRAGFELPLRNMVMQFRESGELWGVDPFESNGETGERFFADAAISHFFAFIRDNLPVLARQGAKGPYEVIMGVTGLEGRHWVTQTRWGGNPVALEESAEARFTLNGTNEEQWLDTLVPAWGTIASAFGVGQPPRDVMLKQIRGHR